MTSQGTPEPDKAKASRAKASVSVGETPAAKPSGKKRTLWIVLIVLLVLGACCVCSAGAAWVYGDAAVEFFRNLNIQ